jgi:lysyl-tRNA synthetase, class II
LRGSQSPNPYPHKFEVSTAITAYIEKYGVEGKITAGTRLDGVTEALAGRIHNIRASGSKLKFYDLHGEGKKVQIMATLQ